MRWAIVDVETTGLHVVSDQIIEIAVRIRTDEGLRCTWHRFINPERTIPGLISALTGITNEMVHHAPTFDVIAKELFELLQDCVLVAHNARFDFGFLKNAFKRAGYTYKAPVLCTIKLIKFLSPKLTSYKLSSLAALYNIQAHNEHRALGDVDTLDALIQHLFNDYSQEKVLAVAQSLYKKSSIPSKLATDISAFPNTPGVYLFYSKKTTAPIYIGKSVNLRQRILSHFQADYTHAKEFAMAQHIERVEIIPTAGELSALLLESELIKEKMPIYNRRLRRMKQSVGFKLNKANGYTTLSLERYLLEEDTDLSSLNLYGTFRSIAAAKRILMALVQRHHSLQAKEGRRPRPVVPGSLRVGCFSEGKI